MIDRTDKAARESRGQGGKPPLTRSDCVLIRRGIANHWPVTVEQLAVWLRELEATLQATDSPRIKLAALKTLVAVVGQMQSALEWEAQQQRLDEGKPTENVAVQEYRFAFDRRG